MFPTISRALLLVALLLTARLGHSQTLDELMAQGEYAQAAQQGQLLLKEQPNDLRLLLQTAQAHFRTDALPEAQKLLKHSLGLDSTQIAVLRLLAECYEESGNTDTAIAYYQRVLQLRPTHTATLRTLAQLHFRDDKYGAAHDYYQQLEAHFPQQALYTRMRAQCKWLIGNQREGYALMQTAFEKDSFDLKTIVALAKIQINAAKPDEALRTLGGPLQRAPENAQLHYLAGRAHFANNHHFRAMPHWETLLAAGDSSYNVLMFAGRSLQGTLKYTKAVQLLEMAYQLDSTFLPTVQALAYSYAELKQPATSLRYTQRYGRLLLPKTGEEYIYYETLAERLEQAGLYAQAAKAYADIPQLMAIRDPKLANVPRSLMQLARLHDYSLKDYPKAITYYQKFLDAHPGKQEDMRKELDEVAFRINYLREQMHFERKQ